MEGSRARQSPESGAQMTIWRGSGQKVRMQIETRMSANRNSDVCKSKLALNDQSLLLRIDYGNTSGNTIFVDAFEHRTPKHENETSANPNSACVPKSRHTYYQRFRKKYVQTRSHEPSGKSPDPSICCFVNLS